MHEWTAFSRQLVFVHSSCPVTSLLLLSTLTRATRLFCVEALYCMCEKEALLCMCEKEALLCMCEKEALLCMCEKETLLCMCEEEALL